LARVDEGINEMTITVPVLLSPGNMKRWRQLCNAALNLGMRNSDAVFYANRVLCDEMERGDWSITPNAAEAVANDQP